MFFWKFLSEEAETIFWESEAKVSKLFKSKFGHRKILRKWFSCYLEFKNECSESLKRAFLIFFPKFLSDEVATIFWETEAKCSKLFKSKFGHRNFLRKWF